MLHFGTVPFPLRLYHLWNRGQALFCSAPSGYAKSPNKGGDGKRHDPGSDLLFQRASP